MTDQSAFSRSQINGLIEAVAAHDTVDLAAILPPSITLDYDLTLLERCYWLSHHLWEEVEYARLRRIATNLMWTGTLNKTDARAFKDIRARAKQLRFVYGALSAEHKYPVVLDHLTRIMGHAQDAAKNRQRKAAAVRGLLLRAMLNRHVIRALARELAGFTIASPASLHDHVVQEVRRIEEVLTLQAITNKLFHDTRKIVSRLVALYDTFTVLAPSEYHLAITRYLSTINGLMGSFHDNMIVRKVSSRRAYLHAVEPLPHVVLIRLEILVKAFCKKKSV